LTKLEDEELEFAKSHLERFDDSDFFPKLSVYEAIWANWDEFSERLKQSNVGKVEIEPANSIPTAKGRTTYRIVHQLEPLTSIVYNALVYKVAPSIEESLQKRAVKIACSNRFSPVDGSYYANGSGYDDFKERSKEFSENYSYFATTDVSDYYNQVYSHRVRGAIEAAAPDLEKVATDLESVIHRINAKASKGIPVGPHPSGILSESIMIDIDQLIQRLGVEHTRYVDDFRFASNDPDQLDRVIEELSIYLFKNHRLHLNSEKTKILSKEKFISSVLKDHEDDEVEAAIQEILVLNPYSEEISSHQIEGSVDSEDALKNVTKLIKERYEKNGMVDLNLLKSYFRRCRLVDFRGYVEVARLCLPAFLPVFHELAKTMEVTIKSGGAKELTDLISKIIASPFSKRRAVRLWLSWVAAGSDELLGKGEIRSFVFSSNLRSQARAAMTVKDLAWVRGHRESLMQHSVVDRSEIIMATSILGKDERKNFLFQIGGANSHPVDVAGKKFVLE